MEPALEKTIMGSNTSREHVSLWGCSEGVPGGEEGEARPGRLLAGMVTHEGTVTHSRAHSASAFASTGRRASRSTPPPAAQDIKTGCPCGRLHRSSRGRSRGAIAAFKAGGGRRDRPSCLLPCRDQSPATIDGRRVGRCHGGICPKTLRETSGLSPPGSAAAAAADGFFGGRWA